MRRSYLSILREKVTTQVHCSLPQAVRQSVLWVAGFVAAGDKARHPQNTRESPQARAVLRSYEKSPDDSGLSVLTKWAGEPNNVMGLTFSMTIEALGVLVVK